MEGRESVALQPADKPCKTGPRSETLANDTGLAAARPVTSPETARRAKKAKKEKKSKKSKKMKHSQQ